MIHPIDIKLSVVQSVPQCPITLFATMSLAKFNIGRFTSRERNTISLPIFVYRDMGVFRSIEQTHDDNDNLQLSVRLVRSRPIWQIRPMDSGIEWTVYTDVST